MNEAEKQYRNLVERLFLDGITYSRNRRDCGHQDWQTVEEIAEAAVRAANLLLAELAKPLGEEG